MFAHPTEHVEAAVAWHFQIEEDNVRPGEAIGGRESPLVLKEIDHLLAIIRHKKFGFELGPMKRVIEEIAVVLGVFDEQDIERFVPATHSPIATADLYLNTKAVASSKRAGPA